MALVIPSIKVSSVFGCRRGESPAKTVSNPQPRSLKTVSILKSYEKSSGAVQTRLRVRVYSSIKDCEVRVSDRDQNMRLIGQFSAPVKQEPSSSPPKSTQSKEEEEKQKYYVNMGYAIRTLREEFPELFYRELSFDVYRDDIVFKDPFNTFIGIENYKSIFWALRFHGKIFFKALWVDIISVWQPVESVIMVRWVVHGIPRVPWESRGRFDGTSEYKLDKKGKIFEHRVDNIAFNQPPKFRVLGVEELIQTLGCPSTPKPTYFEYSSSPVMKFVQLLGRLTSARHYLDGTLAIGRRHDSKTTRS